MSALVEEPGGFVTVNQVPVPELHKLMKNADLQIPDTSGAVPTER